MARDDDDDDGVSEEPLPKSRKDRADDDDEDDRPRKKSRDDKDDRPVKEVKPMPVQLVAAIMASFAWGFLALYFGCLHVTSGTVQEIQIQKMQRQQEENLRKMRDQIKAMGGQFNMPPDRLETGSGLRYTIVGSQVFMFLMAVILVAGAALLLFRKGFAKFVVLGAAVGMLFVEFVAFVICLIINKADFSDKLFAHYNIDFCNNMTFSLLVGGCVAALVFNKDVSKALK